MMKYRKITSTVYIRHENKMGVGMSDMSWESHIRSEDESNYHKCIDTAKKNGHTPSEAEPSSATMEA